jgi:hypothetical protein
MDGFSGKKYKKIRRRKEILEGSLGSQWKVGCVSARFYSDVE